MKRYTIGDKFNALGKSFTVIEVVKKDVFKIKSEEGDVFLKCGRFYSRSK